MVMRERTMLSGRFVIARVLATLAVVMTVTAVNTVLARTVGYPQSMRAMPHSRQRMHPPMPQQCDCRVNKKQEYSADFHRSLNMFCEESSI